MRVSKSGYPQNALGDFVATQAILRLFNFPSGCWWNVPIWRFRAPRSHRIVLASAPIPRGRFVARIVRFPVAVGGAANRLAGLFSAQRAFVVALLLAASSFLPLRAQVFDASPAGGPVTITASWRFHTGDDPQWASPSFDESQWSLLRMDRSWNVQGYRGYSGYAWYRIRLHVPTSREPLALALALDRVGNAAEIYADGQPIGEMGRCGPSLTGSVACPAGGQVERHALRPTFRAPYVPVSTRWRTLRSTSIVQRHREFAGIDV